MGDKYMGILDFLKKVLKSEDVNVIQEHAIENKKQIIYEKMIEVNNTSTEGRQKLIKQLIKNDDFIKDNNFFQNELIGCDVDIEDDEMPSGKKCIKVVVRLDDNGYSSQLGYIPESFEDELHSEVKKADSYSVDLYVSTEDNGKYSLKVNIKFYKF